MALNPPFSTSEIVIGSTKNKIFITDQGNMIFNDGSLDGTDLEGGVTLAELANLENKIELDDLIDASEAQSNKSYLLFRNSDDSWKSVEYTPPSVTVENLNDIQDVSASNPSDGDVLTFSNGLWRNIPKSTTVIIQVESSDWTYNATVIDGDPGYTVSVPHNLGLTLPEDLLDISLWNLSNEKITISKVQQQANAVYLESTVNLDLYITMRKA